MIHKAHDIYQASTKHMHSHEIEKDLMSYQRWRREAIHIPEILVFIGNVGRIMRPAMQVDIAKERVR